MTDTDWEQIAQDPNSLKWDEEQVASLQKFVENTKRLQDTIEGVARLHPYVSAGMPDWVKCFFCQKEFCSYDEPVHDEGCFHVTWKAER